mmetsp:Transcript_51597/g.136308  ORF Transcript_51597/g.136308 Transcript_51597/m.136308 type:complete len:201 (+) Transcript_51597:489-1091(+)
MRPSPPRPASRPCPPRPPCSQPRPRPCRTRGRRRSRRARPPAGRPPASSRGRARAPWSRSARSGRSPASGPRTCRSRSRPTPASETACTRWGPRPARGSGPIRPELCLSACGPARFSRASSGDPSQPSPSLLPSGCPRLLRRRCEAPCPCRTFRPRGTASRSGAPAPACRPPRRRPRWSRRTPCRPRPCGAAPPRPRAGP